mmetsp:Transcript_70801/g.200582  ORF Transcript_70801/g.200582 Transcript_70801/m.200582 type:complete len:236 (-) Transcript_70801:303-1010(-)
MMKVGRKLWPFFSLWWMRRGAEGSRLQTASSLSTFSTASSGQFLCACTLKPGPSSDMSRTWRNNEFTLLWPKTWKKRPTWSDQPALLANSSAVSRMASTSATASCGLAPPLEASSMPKARALNHCQCRFRVVRKQCLRAIDAREIHLGSWESQCMSASRWLAQIMNLPLCLPRSSCAGRISGCRSLPEARCAKALKGLSETMRLPLPGSTKPEKTSSSKRASAPPSSPSSWRACL